MAVKSTYSSRNALADIQTIIETGLSPLVDMESILDDTKHKMDEVVSELKKTRTGHELFLWEEEVEEVNE